MDSKKISKSHFEREQWKGGGVCRSGEGEREREFGGEEGGGGRRAKKNASTTRK